MGVGWKSDRVEEVYTVEPLHSRHIGTQLAILCREVSLIQRQSCTQLYVVGAADSVLIKEVSLIQSVLYREVPLYTYVVRSMQVLQKDIFLSSLLPYVFYPPSPPSPFLLQV